MLLVSRDMNGDKKGRPCQATLSLKLGSARDDSGDACPAEGIIIVVVVAAQCPSHCLINIPHHFSVVSAGRLSSGLNRRLIAA
ncbi:MAG: hypothetical protein ACK4JD_07500 [Thermoflexales bacterium]